MWNALAMFLAIILMAILRQLRDPNWWREYYQKKAKRDSEALLARFTRLRGQ